jgi:hypothetical protein
MTKRACIAIFLLAAMACSGNSPTQPVSVCPVAQIDLSPSHAGFSAGGGAGVAAVIAPPSCEFFFDSSQIPDPSRFL